MTDILRETRDQLPEPIYQVRHGGCNSGRGVRRRGGGGCDLMAAAHQNLNGALSSSSPM